MSMTATAIPDGRKAKQADSLSRRPIQGESRFGDLLISQSLLNLRDLKVAIERAAQRQIPLADAIVQLGVVSETDCYRALACATGLRLVDLSEVTPSTLALRLVPERVARRHVLLPLEQDNRALTYAISRPFDDEAERDVAFASGRKPCAVLARPSDLSQALDRCYPKMADINLPLARRRSETVIELIDCGDTSVPTESPIIDLCNHIIARAVEAAASGVHIEPTPQGLVVRYRLCGILEPMLTLPPETAISIRNRYKVMARTDISVRHRPQDGRFRLLVNGRPIDVRFSTFPTIKGENLVMRVIDSQATPHDLASLGFDAMHAAGCHSIRERGLALVAEGITSIDQVNGVLASDAAAPGKARSTNKRRVLVADDDGITRLLVKLLFEKEGYEVLEGENGGQAVEIANRERPDLLIIDLMMPERDGYRAIEQIRRDVSFATLPVIVLTAEDGPGTEHRVLEMGADDYMIKPFDPTVLLSRVRAVFRRVERGVMAA